MPPATEPIPVVLRMPVGWLLLPDRPSRRSRSSQYSDFDWKLSGSCFDDESHDKDCNRDSATKVSNVCVESFHAVIAGSVSLLFFLWLMAKA